jgi:two-component system KDP operon response regulator KdpE
MKKVRILIIEDEPKVIHLLKEVLSAANYEILVTYNGDRAPEMVALEQPDLILLDIVLAGALDGYAICKRIREFSEVPVIMVTAKARENDLLRGFEAGADDYITKPFSAKELLARINAVIKRTRRESVSTGASEIICNQLKIDLVRHRVLLDGREIHLTPTEYNLLCLLANHPNQVMLHEQLLTEIWGAEYRNDIDYLRAYIHSLRQKVEIDPTEPKIIVRCPGVGYMLTCQEQ